MKLFGLALAFSALVFTVVAYPESVPEVSVDSNIAAVDKAIRQQSSEFLKYIYANMRQPQPAAPAEVIEELIAASIPDSIREEVAHELEAGSHDGNFSDGLKERINLHIIEWSIQYIPEDFQQDIRTALKEYRATGQVSGNNDELIERIRQYVASLEGGRNKRGFWSVFYVAIINHIVDWLIG